MLAGNKNRYKAGIDENDRCKELELVDRGCCVIGREYRILGVWVRHHIEEEY